MLSRKEMLGLIKKVYMDDEQTWMISNLSDDAYKKEVDCQIRRNLLWSEQDVNLYNELIQYPIDSIDFYKIIYREILKRFNILSKEDAEVFKPEKVQGIKLRIMAGREYYN